MTTTMAAREIGRIEREILSQPSEPSQSTAKPTTSAPAPITPVSGAGDKVEKDPSKMNFWEFEEWRRSGGGK